jgi:hypothetical protein
MRLIYDTGGLISLERGDRSSWVRLKAALGRREIPLSNAAVLGQAWRGGTRQALLARALDGMEVMALDEELGRRAGTLLGLSATNDVVDAALVLGAADGDKIVTSDAADLAPLARACRLHIELVAP